MQVQITLTTEQLQELSKSVNTITINQTIVDEFIKHLLSKEGEAEELTIETNRLNTYRESHNCNHTYVNDNIKKYVTFRQKVILSIIDACKIDILNSLDEQKESINNEARGQLRSTLPALIQGAMTSFLLDGLKGSITNLYTESINNKASINEITNNLKQRQLLNNY